MPPRKKTAKKSAKASNGANLGFEATLWKAADKGAGKFEDVAGLCKSATTDEIAAHGFVLTPGRYVGAEAVEDDGEPFEEKMQRLTAELDGQFAESARLMSGAVRVEGAERS